MLKKEEIIASKTIYEGRIIDLRIDTVKTCNAKESVREIVQHPDGVGVVAIDDKNRICLVRQYRNPFDDFILEIPAGKVEKGEDVAVAAKRELEEETGYSAEEVKYMGYAMVSPGFCNERVHIFLATGLKEGKCHFDEDEYVEQEMYDLDEAFSMVMNSTINDAKTIIGILKAKEILSNINRT